MLGIHFLGSGIISLDEVPTPQPKDQNVVVKINAAGICGTDRHPLMEHGQQTIPGHENAGVIATVDKPTRVKVGDRVGINCHITCHACEHCLRGDLYFCDKLEVTGFEWDGGFAEYILVPESCCMSLPADISFDMGALLVDVLGTAYRGVTKAGLMPGDQVAIWGAGPIGLEAATVATWLGARVAILDPSKYRLEMAKYLKPELMLDPTQKGVKEALMDWTNGRGLDVGYDCVGNENAIHQAMDAVKKRGKVGIIGVSRSLTVDPWDMIQRELSIYATRNFNTNQFAEMTALIQRGMPVDFVVTHKFPLKDAEKAFALFRSGECGKIVFTG